MNFHMTIKSRNVKTGKIPVTTSTAATCPDACPLKKTAEGKAGPCYANSGPLGMFWKKVTEGKAGKSFADLLQSVASLPADTLWRHNQSGDLIPTAAEKEIIDAERLQELTEANQGKRGFTYSHYDALTIPANRIAIAAANAGGFTVNLSGNNFEHADQLAALDAGPVVTIAPLEYQRTTEKAPQGGKQWAESLPAYKERIEALGLTTAQGRRVVICPATFSDDVSCATCKLCQKQRSTIVGFPAHGVSKRKASAIAETALPAYAIAAE